MPRAGEITVPITVEAARAARDWLANVYIPAKKASPLGLLGDPAWRDMLVSKLTELVEFIGKKVDRKRNSKTFSINIDRATVSLYVLAVNEMDPFKGSTLFGYSPTRQIAGPGTMPFLVWEAAAWMRSAAQSRACRPRLTPQQRKQRLSPQYAYDERNRKRLKIMVRRDEEIAQRLRKGVGLLGTPKI